MKQSLTLIPYTIDWDAPADDGGSKIDKYQARFSIRDSGYSDWVDFSTDSRFVALLPNDVEITIEIRAVNDVGPGEASILQITPVREPNLGDSKKQIGEGAVNIHLPDAPKTPKK